MLGSRRICKGLSPLISLKLPFVCDTPLSSPSYLAHLYALECSSLHASGYTVHGGAWKPHAASADRRDPQVHKTSKPRPLGSQRLFTKSHGNGMKLEGTEETWHSSAQPAEG
ncbi:hypothetical protein FQA47_018806 [Oryzias melastigma]|uniref:Uncharacterized protein n=1 Tax=Oryzias melastigma TaxID=30732 RepID=A0A834F1T9_ORYME|nr:hypothetical protein FQA47_018806 [Oryzias melastigma]